MQLETPTLESAPAVSSTPRPNGRVLVVDDEEQNRALLRDPLEARGYEVIEAVDGFSALGAVLATPPDVILLDVMMPGMDGFEVCRQLKQDQRTAHVPILMITALSERKERLMGVKAGANDFLNKPVDVQDVLLRVANAVHAKRLFDELQRERDRSERLLLNIMPQAIADRMKLGETNIADFHPEATVLLADLVGFTMLSAHVSPEQVVCLLNEIFTAFDQLTEQHGLEKIKTIGDAYMVAGGLGSDDESCASAIVELALAMREELERFNRQYDTSIRLRIGIGSGPVVAGIIGRKKFAYDLWGDTVNQTFRLGSMGEPGEILVNESAFEKLRQHYAFGAKQELNAKGYSVLAAYPLRGKP